MDYETKNNISNFEYNLMNEADKKLKDTHWVEFMRIVKLEGVKDIEGLKANNTFLKVKDLILEMKVKTLQEIETFEIDGELFKIDPLGFGRSRIALYTSGNRVELHDSSDREFLEKAEELDIDIEDLTAEDFIRIFE